MSLFVKKKVRGINGKMIGFYGGIVYNRWEISETGRQVRVWEK